VGAPIFYRDVPLMLSIAEGTGVIKPIEGGFVPLIAWRLRDVSLPESKVVLTGMPSCANCHSFSLDGKTLGMDVDGPQGDKGTYAIVPIAKETIIDNERVITWNSFAGKPEGHHTIGFLSRISPNGTHALTTLNESLYVSNFTDFRFLQVFYPTRGILGWWSKETDRIEALPGADDPQYVHCGPAWTPDGSSIVFSRAEAFDPYEPGRPLAQEPNDPNEPRMLYDLYRMPFADGKGGTPVPIEGASNNGMSNTFPKVSPDGKWIVYVKCRNGQLMRPDGRLWIVPLEGGEAREMRCNTPLMNSWHSFSPNGRWMVFSSKSRTPYTQMFLTHIDENGNDTPAILIPNATAENRAVNLPEFVNIEYDDLESIDVPAVNHHRYYQEGGALVEKGDFRGAIPHLEKAVRADPEFVRAHIDLAFSWASLGELGNARSHYERVLDLDPRNPYALSGLGGVSELQGEPQKAAEFYRRALEGDAHFVPAIRSLGLLLLGQREFEAAVAVLENAVHSRPQLDEMRWALVQALRGGGRSADAVPHLEALVDREAEVPGRPDVLLAWILATSSDASVRDGARARAVMEARIAAGEGNDPVVADTLAAAQAEAGDFAAALETTKRAEDLARQYDQGLLAKIQARAALYADGEPFREDPSAWEER
jgi:Flp pilus assembly protein TadD